MMRRIVDGILPACATIALAPIAVGALPIPASLSVLVGGVVARMWLITMTLSFASVTAGVIISKRWPATSFWLQVIPLSYAGVWFTIFIIGVGHTFGLDAWQNMWWELGIAGYFFARSVELSRALREAKQLDRNKRALLDELGGEDTR